MGRVADGWGKLGPVVSTRLVQESLSGSKKATSAEAGSMAGSARRIHVEVLSPNVIWAQDATHGADRP